MTKLATLLLTATALVALNLPAVAQPPVNGPGENVVGVRFGNSPDSPTKILRLEYRMRMLAQYYPGRMVVHTVYPGGPATKLTAVGANQPSELEPGDVVTHVDGAPITNQAEYHRAMFLSSARQGKVRLTVIDGRTGGTVQFDGQAEKIGSGGQGLVRRDAKRATKVKALLLGDTSDKKIGNGVSGNLNAVRLYIEGLPGYQNGDIVEVSGRNMTGNNILTAINRLNVAPDEVVFCYVACHGAHDKTLAAGDPSGGHFLQLDQGDLPRRSLLSALLDRGAQLTVLVSDTCNAPAEIKPIYLGSPLGSPQQQPGIESKAFADLLFNHAGVVDISGSSTGQFGWYTNSKEGGGWFTIMLMSTLRQWPANKPGDWKELVDKTGTDLSAFFQSKKKAVLASPNASEETKKFMGLQSDQRPQAFTLEVVRVQS